MPNVECPHCGQTLEVDEGSEAMVKCPICEKGFNWQRALNLSAPAAPQVATPITPGARWYFATLDGTQYGPTSEAEIVNGIRDGRIPGGSLVWRSGMSNWVPVESTAPFSALFQQV